VWVNGSAAGVAAKANSYVALRRTWKAGDKVKVRFDMTTRLIRANPRVPEDFGKAAVQRGPILYCLEQPESPEASVFDVALSGERFAEETREGVTVLRHSGVTYAKPLDKEPLYGFGAWKASRPVNLTLRPYYLFHDRGPAAMTVWLPLQ